MIDLIGFHACLTNYLKNGEVTNIPSFHRKILELYQNDSRLQLIVAPVGFAKSSTLRSLTLCNLLNGVKFQLYVSSSAAKVAQHFSTFQKFLDTPDFQRLFNYKLIKCNTEQAVIELNGEELALYGVSGGADISGINFQSQRPQYILVDDLEELEQANSIERTGKLMDWLETTLISRLPSLVEGKVRMIGTNLSLTSIVNRIITEEVQGWDYHVFRALDENNRSIWDDVHPTKALLEMQQNNPTVFARNYQNAPIDPSASLIQRDDLRFYDYVDYDSIKHVYIHADTTHTAKTTSDYFCCMAVGKNLKNNNFYVLDFVLDKLDTEKQAKTVIAMYQRYANKVEKITFDEKANQGFGYWAKRLASEEFDISLPLRELKYPNDKVTHFEPHIPHFKANRVYFPSKHPDIQLGVDQLLSFPSKSVNNDFVDAISGCMDNYFSSEIISLDDEVDNLTDMFTNIF